MKTKKQITQIDQEINKKAVKSFLLICLIIIFTIIVLHTMDYFNLIPKKYYKASDFNIKTIYSSIDFDKDNMDDYTDFVLGARKDAENHPEYISKYYDDAYPPDNEGVCTDVIWRAFKNAGYSLRDMVDQDIQDYPEDYNIEVRDANIDFRRVNNLIVYFNRYAISLTVNYKEIDSWQPGDIVVFDNKHIGIISDKRNAKGIPYVIHNNGQPNREEDYLTKNTITNHYRFDASKIDSQKLIKWND